MTIKLRIRYIDRSSYPQKRIKAYQETYQKTYWSIINRFLNNKKIPIISPVFFEGKLTSDFEKKAELLIITLPHDVFLVKDFWSKKPYQTLNRKPMND